MPESPDEKYVRELFRERYGVTLRKIRESKLPGVRTPDYELLSAEARVAVLEVKVLEDVPPTPEKGWRKAEGSGFLTRRDNSAERIGGAIHGAHGQLAGAAEPKVLVLVNDASMDFLDLNEALNGEVTYGTEELGYYRTTSGTRVAEGRIRDEKRDIDLYIWINRYAGRVHWRPSGLLPHEEPNVPFFFFGTDAGHALATAFFKIEAPKREAAPEALPTLHEFLLNQALGKRSS